MGLVTFLALSFIVWWTVIFATLPFSLRTQDDEKDIVLGTTSSAPRGSHMRRTALRTTVVTLVVMGVLYLIVNVWGLGFDDLPNFLPEFR